MKQKHLKFKSNWYNLYTGDTCVLTNYNNNIWERAQYCDDANDKPQLFLCVWSYLSCILFMFSIKKTGKKVGIKLTRLLLMFYLLITFFLCVPYLIFLVKVHNNGIVLSGCWFFGRCKRQKEWIKTWHGAQLERASSVCYFNFVRRNFPSGFSSPCSNRTFEYSHTKRNKKKHI